MIGSLLKELAIGLFRYARFHITRLAGKPLPVEGSEPVSHASSVLGPAGSAAFRQRRSAPDETIAEPPIYRPVAAFDWRALSETRPHLYMGGPSSTVLDLLSRPPRFALDIGCSDGSFGMKIKAQFPEAKVWGVEPNPVGAREASARLDRVLVRTFDQIDWQGEGVRRGEIDTVFLFDVLEHIYDPWKTLLDLRNLVSPQAQVVTSIPNVRNLFLIQDLVSGFWRYTPAGLLDITHIRFFTQDEMIRMFYQTGFRLTASTFTLCPRSREVFAKYCDGSFPQRIELESASITVHSKEDLVGLCALQHICVLAPVEHEALRPDERRWIDDPHPQTMAFAPEPEVVVLKS
jgi:2-polyprenyl-3-methyl-5-hydroxy-6-metoxy-1,4-benzoquinol methylase